MHSGWSHSYSVRFSRYFFKLFFLQSERLCVYPLSLTLLSSLNIHGITASTFNHSSWSMLLFRFSSLYTKHYCYWCLFLYYSLFVCFTIMSVCHWSSSIFFKHFLFYFSFVFRNLICFYLPLNLKMEEVLNFFMFFDSFYH